MNNYQDFGFNDAEKMHHHDYIFIPLEKVLSSHQHGRMILDVGCGNGWIAKHLLHIGYDVIGIDASESGIKEARKVDLSPHHYDHRFFLQDLQTGTLPKEISNYRFNTIISTEVIEHLYDPGQYVDFCKKILQKNGGGELILTTPYNGYWKNLAIALLGKMDKHYTVNFLGGHIKFFSRKTITKLLQEKGFKVDQFIGCGRAPYLWKSMLIKASIQSNGTNDSRQQQAGTGQ